MTLTHLREGEQFPTSAKATVIVDDIITATVKELKNKPCGEGFFCEKAMICDGIHCIPSQSER